MVNAADCAVAPMSAELSVGAAGSPPHALRIRDRIVPKITSLCFIDCKNLIFLIRKFLLHNNFVFVKRNDDRVVCRKTESACHLIPAYPGDIHITSQRNLDLHFPSDRIFDDRVVAFNRSHLERNIRLPLGAIQQCDVSKRNGRWKSSILQDAECGS